MKWRDLAIGALLWLSLGCSGVSGPPFEPVRELPQGKALVYIYRPYSFAGSAVSYHVIVGSQRIVFLEPGGYFPYFAEPGETEFWAMTEARETITTDLEPGGTYYLKGGVGIGVGMGRPRFEFVDESRGAREASECKRLPAAYQQEVSE